MALLAWLAACYTETLQPLRSARTLASQQMSLLVEFIDANLATNLGMGRWPISCR